MPLSVPANTNPIAKQPIACSDGDIVPVDLIRNSINLLNITGGTSSNFSLSGAFWDSENGHLYFANNNANPPGSSNESLVVYRIDGFSETVLATASGGNFNAPDVTATFTIFWMNNNLWRVWDNTGFGSTNIVLEEYDGLSTTSLNVYQLTGTDVANLYTMGFSSVIPDNATKNLFWIIGEDGSGNVHLVQFDLSGAVMQDINTGISGDEVNDSVFFYNDNFALFTNINQTLRIFDGKTAVVDYSVVISENIGTRNYWGQAEDFVLALENVPNVSDGSNSGILFDNGSNGANFTCNTGETLTEGTTYSFEIFGPNSVNNPTLNDDGQGSFPIKLPGSVSPPIGSLQGTLDLFFDGTTYIVVSLTEDLAQAIYDFQIAVLDNMTATVDPDANDDSDAGYSIRSRWYNTATGEAFLCVDPSVGAAIWVKASLTLDELGSAAVEDVGIGVLGTDPEHANDSGTDTYTSVTNTATPGIGQIRVRDFQSPNTTTTPTLDGRTIKTRDGSALWAGAIDGTHTLYDDGTDYLLLDPILAQAEVYSRSEIDAYAPKAVTDGGTDAYTVDLGTNLSTDDVFLGDVDSANTTATPTLENTGGTPSGAKNVVDQWGNAWIGMLAARTHRFQWNGTSVVVLDPHDNANIWIVEKTNTATLSSTTFTDISGLSITLTPDSVDDEFLVTAHMVSSGSDGAGSANEAGVAQFLLVRDSGIILQGDGSGNRFTALFSGNLEAGSGSADSASGSALSSPGTTSSTTFKVQWRARGTAGQANLNRSATDGNDTGTGRWASTLIVQRVRKLS